jgi:protein TonB
MLAAMDPQAKRERLKAAAAVALLHLAIGYALVSGLGVRIVRDLAPQLKLFDVALPPPPPAPKTVPARQRTPRPEGAASPTSLKASPSPIVAPPALVPVPSPLPTTPEATPVPRAATATRAPRQWTAQAQARVDSATGREAVVRGTAPAAAAPRLQCGSAAPWTGHAITRRRRARRA